MILISFNSSTLENQVDSHLICLVTNKLVYNFISSIQLLNKLLDHPLGLTNGVLEKFAVKCYWQC
jgi:hypothetical protein